MTTDEQIDDAYAEKAVREEHDDASAGRERVTDLSEPRSLIAMPLGPVTHAPAGAGFLAPTWDLGDDQGTGIDRADRSAGTRYRPNQRVADLVSAGHGFLVRRFSNPDRPEVCKYCGHRLLLPDPSSACEFEAPAHPAPVRAPRPRPTKYGVPQWCRSHDGRLRRRYGGTPTPAGIVAGTGQYRCRCNGCVIARDGRRKAGGQEVACYAAACRQRLADDQRNANRRKQAKRQDEKNAFHRACAVPLLLSDPSRSDRDIAAEIDAPIKRVRETRESLGTAH